RLDALWPEVRTSIGVHPHQAHQFCDDPDRVVQLVRDQIASAPATRAIGEIGLDYHYDFSPRDVQQQVFRAQIRLARELRLPVVIHTREAEADTTAFLKQDGGGDLRGVLHCFTGTATLARAALDLGLLISLPGIVTFPKASELRDTVKTIPLDRLLAETDSPFLAPVPFRGKRNEPAHIARIVDALAQLHGLAPQEVGERTTANFHELFRP